MEVHLSLLEISSRSFISPFDDIAHGFDGTVVRVNAWDSAEELKEMALEEFHNLVQEGVELLKERIDVSLLLYWGRVLEVSFC